MPDPSRLRFRLPNGAEFEASGDPEFIRSERSAFLDIRGAQDNLGSGNPTPATAQGTPTKPIAEWSAIAETNGNNIQLRAKLKHDKTRKDACLVLLAAAQRLLNQPRPTAAQLARWLRASGYPVGRIDRALSEALGRGEILASGSRRARRYQLTNPGLVKASWLAEQLLLMVPRDTSNEG